MKDLDLYESANIIKYKWQKGVYHLSYMAQLVRHNVLTKEQFHSITGYNYDGISKGTST